MRNLLKVQRISVSVADKVVLSDINLSLNFGEIHVIMGPNGSGKSSLALALMGHPAYRVTGGRVLLEGKDLLSLKPDRRAASGLFLSFQHPPAIPDVTLGQLIWSSYKNITGDNKTDVREFYSNLQKQARLLGLKEEILERFANDGFSGGEKKKAEILMLLNSNPKLAIFDEIDSGLDIDSLKKIAKVINRLVKRNTGVILITHNQKILQHVKPDFIYVLKAGKIVRVGDYKLALEIEEKGYATV